MYSVAVRREWIARHFLVGGDWGAENREHAHTYQVEIQLEGEELDEHGYLVDIVALEGILAGMAQRYRRRLLNELPEFAGLNPSLENFSRILFNGVKSELKARGVSTITVRLWETPQAWAAYRGEC